MPRRSARRGKSRRSGRSSHQAGGGERKQGRTRGTGGAGGRVMNTRGLPGGFGDSATATLRYSGRYALTTTISPTFQRFNSSVFDPDYTGGGLQPSNFDDYNVHYNYFWVTGMRVRVEAIATAAAPVLAMVFSRDIMSSYSVEDIQAAPYSKVVFPRTTGGTNQVWHLSMSMPKLFGLTRSEYLGDPTYSCTGAANPAQTGHFLLCQESYDLSTSSIGYYQVVIDYDVVCAGRYSGTLDLDARIARMRAMQDAKPKSRDPVQGVHRISGRTSSAGRESKDSSQMSLTEADVIKQVSVLQASAPVAPEETKGARTGTVETKSLRLGTAETKAALSATAKTTPSALTLEDPYLFVEDHSDMAGYLLWKKQQALERAKLAISQKASQKTPLPLSTDGASALRFPESP